MGKIEQTNYDALYRLLSAWLHGENAGEAPPDWEQLLQAAGVHGLTAAVCMALEGTGLMDRCPPDVRKRFEERKATSVYRTILMDVEREKILAFMEERGIWYLPLKGIVLKELYPALGARQMADNDILIDADAWKTLRDHMRKNGYKWTGSSVHDAYVKPPVYRFEMHRKPIMDDFQGKEKSAFAAYYGDMKRFMRKDGDDRFGYHLSDEDFYVYLLAHAYKHCIDGGTGIRTLLDIYVYRRAKQGLDEALIAAETEKLGIRDFETRCRTLADKLFGSPSRAGELTEEEARMLAWMESSGTYGTVKHQVQLGLREMEKSGKSTEGGLRFRYILRQIFPGLALYRVEAPFAYRHRWAIPFYWAYRLFRATFIHGRRNLSALRALVCEHGEER